MPSGPVLAEAGVGVSLDGQLYMLARQEATRAVLGPTGRRWQVRKQRITLPRKERSDVQPGLIEGEWVLSATDWSHGARGLRDPQPGTYHECRGVDPTKPGQLTTLRSAITTFTDGTLDNEADPTTPLEFNNDLYLMSGRAVYVPAPVSVGADVDFGTGVACTCAVVFDNQLVAALGSGTGIRVRTTASWGAAGTNYANYLTVVEDRLWRSTNTNEVSNILTGTAPDTGTWSAGIPVGDDDVPITALASYGERLAVAKENGLFLGDSGAIFPNVLPQVEGNRHPDNGKNLFVHGDALYYPLWDGTLLRYRDGLVEDVSISNQVTSLDATSAAYGDPPGYVTTALASDGNAIWAATEGLGMPWKKPSGFAKTTDGTTYTSLLTNVTDNDSSTTGALSSLSTLADNDWFIVGYGTTNFYGVRLLMANPNSNTSVLTAQYWNGAWTAFDGTINKVFDGTSKGGKTLGQSGTIAWGVASPPIDWAKATLNGINAYWVRFSVSVALDSITTITEARVLTSPPRTTLWRGRSPHEGDDPTLPIVWDNIYTIPTTRHPTAFTFVSPRVYPFMPFGGIVVGGRNLHTFLALEPSHLTAIPDALARTGWIVISTKDHAGMPLTNKYWHGITVQATNLSAAQTLSIYYRTDESASWTSSVIDLTASNTEQSIATTGRALQWYIQAGTLSSPPDEPIQLTKIVARFRELPTYKSEFTFLLEMWPGQFSPAGGSLPHPAQQLAALYALLGASPITLVDSTGTSYSVIVQAVDVQEVTQSGYDFPSLQVQVKATEA